MLKPAAIPGGPAAAIEVASGLAPYLSDLAKAHSGFDDPDALLDSAYELCRDAASGEGDPFARLR
ncbi:MAG: hypothetical protein AAFY82_11035, partial [Pseudomonadota bacterium]